MTVEPAEFLTKIIIIATLCFGILGMIVESSQFEGIVKVQDSERMVIDLAHAVSAAPCLTEKAGGEGRKGLILESALTKTDVLRNPCITLDARWSVTITDGTSNWIMGDIDLIKSEYSRTLPIAIRKEDGSVVPGKLTARVA